MRLSLLWCYEMGMGMGMMIIALYMHDRVFFYFPFFLFCLFYFSWFYATLMGIPVLLYCLIVCFPLFSLWYTIIIESKK